MFSPFEDENTQNGRNRLWSAAVRFMPAIMTDGIWVVVAKLVSQLSQIATFFLAARVLSPAEFGLFAFVSAIAVLLVVVAEGGWAEFIMKAGDEESFDQVATISLLSGCLFSAVGAVAAVGFYALTSNEAQCALLAMFSFWMLPAALTAAFDGMLVVCGRLRQRAIVRIIAEVVSMGATLILLHLHGQASALAASRIICQVMLLTGSVLVAMRLPRLHLTKSMLAEVMAFSSQIVGNRLVVFAGSYSATLVVGSFLGVADAGFYRAAERIVAAVSELLGEPARSLSWVVFRKAHRQSDASGSSVGRAGVRFVLVLLAVAAPMYLGLAEISDTVVRLMLGDVWMPTASIIPFLCLRQLLYSPGYVNEASLSVLGQIGHRFPVTLLNVAVSLAVTIAVARFGLWELAVAQCFTAAIALVTSIRLQSKFAGVNWLDIWKGVVLLIAPANLVMAAMVFFIRKQLSGDLPSPAVIVLQAGAGALIYAVVLLVVIQLTKRRRWASLE